MLDRKGKLLACKRLTEGGVAGADLNIRLLVSNALLTSASAVILAHNHPSGVALPPRRTTPPRSGQRRRWAPSAWSWRTTSSWRTGTSCPWRTAVPDVREKSASCCNENRTNVAILRRVW